MNQFLRMNLVKVISYCLLILTVLSCVDKRQGSKTEEKKEKPNILWIFLEDTAPLLSSYGETLIQTPNIDSLAQKGTLYTNVYMPAPVCSASRSSIITGVMSTTTGTHNHHSSRTKESAIYLPDHLKTIPELFKNAGYFTFNNGKDDYNFVYNRRELYDQNFYMHPLYGKSGERLDLGTLKNKQPFFGQIQLYGGKEIFSSTFKERVKTPVDRSKIKLPPYLPDHPVVIEEYGNHLDAIQITDEKVGDIIKKLRKSNLLKNTIVFFFSDHGMRLTRNKQFLYDGGLQVPLIIADFTKSNDKISSGIKNSDLISGLDLGISSLVLADIPVPDYMEGKNMFNPKDKREYVISTRDRCDFTIDRIRSVRSKEFKYIRNFMTDRPYTQPTYMDVDGIDFVKVMHQLHAENKLDTIQDRFMSDDRPKEEFYNLREDPFELNNLADDPKYAQVIKEYANVLDAWINETDDKGQYPEDEENLKLMLGIWGEHAINPEYVQLRKKYPDLASSLFYLKKERFKQIDSTITEDPLIELNGSVEDSNGQ
ncbi:sulfatase [Aquimarina sp. 2201CG5-10]|uniref:sulfatase family protein n=1 Tax=Aquimarina callyspongiae TaxID=3098150 RepID=UPI002AB4063B|nr:sulfatase [Aquimarina sp. 2201CG5-10]MDY8134179.1 sulfatase [Aquimarina sp. 2201CG5-10]